MQSSLVVVRSHQVGWQEPARYIGSSRWKQRDLNREGKEIARPPAVSAQPRIFHEGLVHDVDSALVAGVDAALEAGPGIRVVIVTAAADELVPSGSATWTYDLFSELYSKARAKSFAKKIGLDLCFMHANLDVDGLTDRGQSYEVARPQV